MTRLKTGDVVSHFKREYVEDASTNLKHVYKILCMDAIDTRTDEKVVVYQGLYPPYAVFTRPLEEFLSEVDKSKYPDVKQAYRMELYSG